MQKLEKILVSIPAKDEAKTIASVINRSREVIKSTFPSAALEILVINDGSRDESGSIASEHGAKVIHHESSIGLGNVFFDAVSYATADDFDLLITIDGDGQFSEEDIPSLVKPIQDGVADFVTGSRFLKNSKTNGIPLVKYWGNKWVSSLVSSILKKPYRDVSCGFRAYNRKAFCNLNLFGGFTYTQEVLVNLGYKNLRISEMPISVNYHKGRKSRIASNLFRYGAQVLKIIFSSMIFYQPMRFFGSLASGSFIVGVPIVLILGVRYLNTGFLSPYKAIGIIGLIAIVLGIIFLIVGLLLQGMSRLQVSADRSLFYQKFYRK